MKKVIIASALAFMFSGFSLALGPEIFHCIEIKHHADINQNFIENIDSIITPYPKKSSFQIGDIPTVWGKYTVYKFLNAFKGMGASGEKMFHQLLVLKTDSRRKIIDAYLHTLEWIDSPSINLYKLTREDVLLQEGLSIKALGLTNPEGAVVDRDAVLDNVFNCAYQF